MDRHNANPQRSLPARVTTAHLILWSIALIVVLAVLWSARTMYARTQTEAVTAASANREDDRGGNSIVHAFLDIRERDEDTPFESLSIPRTGEKSVRLCTQGTQRNKQGACGKGRKEILFDGKSVDLVFAAPIPEQGRLYLRSKATAEADIYDYAIPCSAPYYDWCPLGDGRVEAKIIRYAFTPTRLLWWALVGVLACLSLLALRTHTPQPGDTLPSGLGVPTALTILLGVRFLIAVNATISDHTLAPYIVLTGLEWLLLPSACWILMRRVDARKPWLLLLPHLCLVAMLWWIASSDVKISQYHPNLVWHLFQMKLFILIDRGVLAVFSDAFLSELFATLCIYLLAAVFLCSKKIRSLFEQDYRRHMRWLVLLTPFLLASLSLWLVSQQSEQRFHWFAFACLFALAFFCVARSLLSPKASGRPWLDTVDWAGFGFLFAMLVVAVGVSFKLRRIDAGAIFLATLAVSMVVYPILFSANSNSTFAASKADRLLGCIAKSAFITAALAMIAMPILKLLYLRDFEQTLTAQQAFPATAEVAQQDSSAAAWMNNLDAPDVIGITDRLNPCRVVPGIAGRGDGTAGSAGRSGGSEQRSSLSAEDVAWLDDCFLKNAYAVVDSNTREYEEKGHYHARFYAWLVGHPYDRIWGHESLGKLQGYQQAIANSVPAKGRWFWGDLALPDARALGTRGPFDGFSYEWLVGLHWIRPFGLLGVCMILIAHVLLYISIAWSNVLARLYVAVIGIASLWLPLQTQGAFVMIGQSTPLLTFTSFVGDFVVVLCPLLILLCIPPFVLDKGTL